MKKHIQIKSSYKIWKPSTMARIIKIQAFHKGIHNVVVTDALIIEWWLHNIIYYLTKPFPVFKNITIRCRDVDLMVKIGGETDV